MKSSKTERTRRHIIAATAPVFNKKGYAGTSITDLTRATRLTSGSIYGNFTNKEEVALAAFDFNLELVRDTVKRAVDACSSTREKLIMSVKVYHSSEKRSFVEGGCPMQNTVVDADDTNNDLRERAAAGLLLWKKDLVKLMRQGITEGVVKPGTDPQKMAWHLVALLEFGFLLGNAFKSRKKTDEMVELALEVVENMLV